MSKNRMAVMAPALEFAFSDNISAENSKFSADSGIHGIQFLECMDKVGTRLRLFHRMEMRKVQSSFSSPSKYYLPKMENIKYYFCEKSGLKAYFHLKKNTCTT